MKKVIGGTGMDTNERELEAMYEFVERNYDPDHAWIDEWEQDNKYQMDKWIQETEERWV